MRFASGTGRKPTDWSANKLDRQHLARSGLYCPDPTFQTIHVIMYVVLTYMTRENAMTKVQMLLSSFSVTS